MPGSISPGSVPGALVILDAVLPEEIGKDVHDDSDKRRYVHEERGIARHVIFS